ncbi:hypothetical protein FOZ63_021426, partial [Perkinsus olseni]
QRTNAAKGGSAAGAAGAQEAAETESVSAADGEEMDPVERLMQAEDRIAELQLMVNRLEQEKFLAEGDAEAQMMLMNGAAAVGSQAQAAEVARLEEELQAAQSDAAKWQKAYEASDFKLKLATEDLDSLQTKYESGVGGLEGHCKKLESELAAAKKSLEEASKAVTGRMEAASKSMEAANKELQRQLAEVVKEKETLEKKTEAAEKEAVAAREEKEEMRQASLDSRGKESAAGSPKAPRGEEVAGSMRDARKIKDLERQLARSNEMMAQLQKRSMDGDSTSKGLAEESKKWQERAETAEAELEELREIVKENETEIAELREEALRKFEERQEEQDEQPVERVAEAPLEPASQQPAVEEVREAVSDPGITTRIAELEEENQKLTLVLVELREKMGEMANRLEQGGVSGGVVEGVLEDVGLASFAGRGRVRRATRNVFQRLYEDALRRLRRLGELRDRVRTLQEQEFLAIYYSRVGYRTFTGYEPGWIRKYRRKLIVGTARPEESSVMGRSVTAGSIESEKVERRTPVGGGAGWPAGLSSGKGVTRKERSGGGRNPEVGVTRLPSTGLKTTFHKFDRGRVLGYASTPQLSLPSHNAGGFHSDVPSQRAPQRAAPLATPGRASVAAAQQRLYDVSTTVGAAYLMSGSTAHTLPKLDVLMKEKKSQPKG